MFKNADFTLNKGEHIGIVGQNGVGKSTFIKICTEQLISDSGRIVMNRYGRLISGVCGSIWELLTSVFFLQWTKH